MKMTPQPGRARKCYWRSLLGSGAGNRGASLCGRMIKLGVDTDYLLSSVAGEVNGIMCTKYTNTAHK